ncbi:DUF7560 family zinc ribbon protein [Candidatus Halobonum tyrrellensis]|uniref:Small CPxCG-related zinc finger protein n=1 Tax=Candidatus Halobonum tyrrellensis G22 TaxID=1324957 RepID=V4J384_9EURY|nr:hypothetical protein [Candidatus Halobonum tyrrellensis]ESP89847.1 hypothetical protein K933_02651 [Candidatus Halobonum tyrrellensis G22]
MSRQFTFDCPECAVEVDVDGDVREAILDEGCVLCGASVGADTFSSASGAGVAE